MRFSRLMLAASGLATVALLGSSAVANAAGTVNGPNYNRFEAGYAIHSAVSFNEVRATIHVPAGSTSSPFIALQETVNGGKTFALGLVYNPGTGFFSLAGIKGLVINGSAGVPFASGTGIVQPVNLGSSTNNLFSTLTGGSFYVELHYSTKNHLVQFIAGTTETDNAVLNIGPSGSVGFGFSGEFHSPAIEAVNFTPAIKQSPSTPQASFTRDGITEPAGSNVGGVAGTRVTFDFFATDEAVATAHGGAPTISGNQITLEPSPALPGVGSAFGISTGPEI